MAANVMPFLSGIYSSIWGSKVATADINKAVATNKIIQIKMIIQKKKNCLSTFCGSYIFICVHLSHDNQTIKSNSK